MCTLPIHALLLASSRFFSCHAQTMIDILFQLEKSEVPDVLLVNSYGSTVLHAATDKLSGDAIEHLFKFTSLGRRKLLMNTKDKTGRQPLHIAAIRGARSFAPCLQASSRALIAFPPHATPALRAGAGASLVSIASALSVGSAIAEMLSPLSLLLEPR